MKKLAILVTFLTALSSTPAIASGGKKNPPKSPDPVTTETEDSAASLFEKFFELLSF